MIDFSTLKGLTIPEGNVTQITDVNGNVLWKQAPSGATVTITVNPGFGGNRLLIDGVYYGNQTTELTVPIGTVITVISNMATVNGTVVTMPGGKYDYTVIGNVSISVTGYKPNQYATVSQIHIYDQ